MIGYVALVITAIIVVSVCVRIDDWKRDWSSNHAETDPSSSDPGLHPVALNQGRDEVAKFIRAWAEAQRDWQFIAEERGQEATKLHLTHATRVFRFIDDVHVTIADNASGVIVGAASRSRFGKGDLGQNPRNLRALTEAIRRVG